MSALADKRTLERMSWARRNIQVLPKDYAVEAAAVVKDLGPRLAAWGLPRTLAFLLQRAAYPKKNPSPRHLAHRWILEVLWSVPHDSWETCFELVSGRQTVTSRKQENLMDSILWLRRYAEWLLPEKNPDGRDKP